MNSRLIDFALSHSDDVGIMPNRSSKRPKRPRDMNQLAKAIVDISAGNATPDDAPVDDGKNPAAVALGRLGGLKGGKARAKKAGVTDRLWKIEDIVALLDE